MEIFSDPAFDYQRKALTPKRIREIIKVGRQHGLKIVVRRVWLNGLLTLLFPHDMWASDYITASRTLQRMIQMDCACPECWNKHQYLIG